MKLLRHIAVAVSKRSLSVSVASSQGVALPHGARTEPSSSVSWAVVMKPCRAAGLSRESSLGHGVPSSRDPALFPLASCCRLDRHNIPQTAVQYAGTPRCMTRHTSPGHHCCGAWQIMCIVTSCHPGYRDQGSLAKSDTSLRVSPRF